MIFFFFVLGKIFIGAGLHLQTARDLATQERDNLKVRVQELESEAVTAVARIQNLEEAAASQQHSSSSEGQRRQQELKV